MQIKNLLVGSTPYDQKKIEKAEKAEAAEKAKSNRLDQSDKVSFSEEATLRSQAMQTARESSGVRAEKVAELKRQVQDGTYQMDNQKIAENIVKEDLDLLI